MTWTVIFKQELQLFSKVFITSHDFNMAHRHIMGTMDDSDLEFVAMIRGEHKPIFKPNLNNA
jgi:hypothetical protein